MVWIRGWNGVLLGEFPTVKLCIKRTLTHRSKTLMELYWRLQCPRNCFTTRYELRITESITECQSPMHASFSSYFLIPFLPNITSSSLQVTIICVDFICDFKPTSWIFEFICLNAKFYDSSWKVEFQIFMVEVYVVI